MQVILDTIQWILIRSGQTAHKLWQASNIHSDKEGLKLAGIGGTDSMQAVAIHMQQPVRLIKYSSRGGAHHPTAGSQTRLSSQRVWTASFDL